MRKLTTPDVFNTLRVIKKAELKEELKPYIKMAAQGDMNIEDIGLDGVLGLIEIMSEKKSETALYEVLSGPFEMSVEEIEKLELDVMVEKLQQLAKENNLKVFTKAVSGLISKQ